MYEHDLLAGHPASEEPSRALTPGDAHTYWVQSWADVAMAAPQAWHQQSPAVLSRDRACARKVLQSFNTWAFKREQPSDPQLLLARVTRAIERSEPLSFVLYWGKGPRCALAQPDVDCLGFLARFSDRIGTTHAPGAALNLIFTDTHARHNGYAATEVREYFDQVHVAARERGFSGCLLSELVQASGLAAEKRLCESAVPEPIRAMLGASARKWYRGSGSPEHGAAVYYRMNMLEQRAVEWVFPWSIFATFNGSELRALFPQHLPIFYMYSLRRGTCVKPWFLPAQTTVSSCASPYPQSA